MKKQTKGAVAAGGAAVLLLGGLGSLAYWSDSETIDGGTITAGQLNMTKDDGVWKDQTATTIDPSSFKVSPGDKLTYTTTLHVQAQGTDMAAKLSANTHGVVSGTLGSEVTTTVTAGAGNTAITNTGAASQDTALTITPVAGAQDIPVKVTLVFPFDSATNGSENGTITLSNISLNLTQVLNTSKSQAANPTP